MTGRLSIVGLLTLTPVLVLAACGFGTGFDRAAAQDPPPAALSPPQEVSIHGFRLDGTRWTCDVAGRELEGILVKPEGGGPFPAIVLSHGLGGTARGLLRRAREFAAQGFVCIAINYTHAGSGRVQSPGKATSPENLRRALACIAILAMQPEVDPRRVCAWGYGLGAHVTVALAAEAPGRLCAAGILAGGIHESARKSYPSVAEARKIRTPFCIVHGEADTRVPPEASALLKSVLDESGVPCERHVFPGDNHLGILHEPKANVVLLEWFRRFTAEDRQSRPPGSESDAPHPKESRPSSR